MTQHHPDPAPPAATPYMNGYTQALRDIAHWLERASPIRDLNERIEAAARLRERTWTCDRDRLSVPEERELIHRRALRRARMDRQAAVLAEAEATLRTADGRSS